MERRHWGQHDETCFACKVQSITVNPYSMPSRLHPNIEPRRPEASWEKGIVRDNRGMPQLTADGTPMGVKEYAEQRHRIEEHKRQMHQAASTGKE